MLLKDETHGESGDVKKKTSSSEILGITYNLNKQEKT